MFLKGDFEARVQATASAKAISEPEARQLVSDTDERRMRYHNYYTGLTWGAASDYDLCIDSMRLGNEATADIIAEYARKVLPAAE